MWKLRNTDKDKENELLKLGSNKLVARLLAQRQVQVSEYHGFINPEYNKISDPYNIHDMEKAVDVFLFAIKNKKKIAVLGDYDCDGVVSSTMMAEICNDLESKAEVFLPSRLNHGYGLSEKSAKDFKKIHDGNPPYLLFLLDCGSNNFSEIEDLRKWGVEKIIVIDHHIISKEKGSYNADAFVSWHLSPNIKEMCTCGLVFQFARGVRWKTSKINPISYLTYGAIGTIADVSPICGDNRILVKNGLNSFAVNSIGAAGLQSLLGDEMTKKGYISQDDISFKIAPKINAVGRINHPDIAFGLLIEKDPGLADKILKYVTSFNDQRKEIQKLAEMEAMAKMKDIGSENLSGIFLSDEKWHIGVAGIVSARITETFYRPSLIVGFHNGLWKGSGRSIPGINVKAILDECSFMFDSYGGHAAACGVTMKPEYLDRAGEIFNQACKKYIDKNNIDLTPVRYYDVRIHPDSINEENAKILLDHIAPYCPLTNQEPIFLLKDVTIAEMEVKAFSKYTLTKIKIAKGGKVYDYWFSSFDIHKKFGQEISGMICDIYFKFPQTIDVRFEMPIIDIEVKIGSA